MARPTTKEDLLNAANKTYADMWALISKIPEDKKMATFNFDDEFLQKQKEAHWKRDKNLRDVLVHLYEWHCLLLNWVNANQKGEPKPFLLEPYNWKTYGQMNVDFWEKHQNTPYEKAIERLKKSHEEVMELIKTFSNDELFSKNYFKWTGTSTLGSYCVSATSSHYEWAMKKIKQHIKTY